MGEWGRVGRMEGGKKEHGEVVEGGGNKLKGQKQTFRHGILKKLLSVMEGGVSENRL